MADSPGQAVMLDGDVVDDSPASNSTSNGKLEADANNGDAVATKRTRVLLSCSPCRASKLKCDRGQPCGNCLKKDRVNLCEYAPRPKKPTKGMAARLRRLEGMLRKMMEDDSAAAAMSSFGVSSAELFANKASGSSGRGNENGSALSFMSVLTEAAAQGYDGSGKPIATSATTRVPRVQAAQAPLTQARGEGCVVRGQRATTYVGATHFMAMLDDIEDLKTYFEDEQQEEIDERPEMSPSLDASEQLLLGGQQPRNRADLLALMPPRNVVDRLVARYFGSSTPTQHTVHRPSFSRKYKAFWQDSVNADIDFMAVLFIIMALGVHFTTYSAPHELESDGTNMSPAERYRLFRAASSAALSLTRLSAPTLNTVQALLMFSESEFLVNRATQTKCFLLLAVCIRLMLKMGLHRDPSRLPTISACEGEIRRRLWNLAIQLDLIVSFYMGLPSMIHGIPSDTSLAHNLLDEDFDEDSPSLPMPRPDSEYTVMSYPIFKSTICRVFGQVARLTHTLTPPTYAEVLRTDRLLEDKWHNIPAFMKVRPLDDCVAELPMKIVQRFGLASLYQKSRCVLHRPYLIEAVPLPEHAYSRRTCLQSALSLLAYHEAIHEATQPGGLLHHLGWFVTGLGMHDILLASMIVYLVVQNERLFDAELVTNSRKSDVATIANKDTEVNSPGAFTAEVSSTVTLPVDRKRLIDLLRRVYHIWADDSEKSNGTTKAADLLSVLLRKIRAREMRENSCPPDWEPPDDRFHESPKQSQVRKHQQQPLMSATRPQIARPNGSVFAGVYGHSSSGSNVNCGVFGGGVEPEAVYGLPLLSESVSLSQSVMPGNFLPASTVMPNLTDPLTGALGASMRFSQDNLVAPSSYDSWIPLSLDELDWGNVDTGIQNVNSQENEWSSGDSDVLSNINFAAADMWGQRDAAPQ